MIITYKYRPSYILLISLLSCFILFLSIALFVYFVDNKIEKEINFFILHTIILSPFIYMCLFWVYYRKNQKIILVKESYISVPHRWKRKICDFKYDEIIYLEKYDSYDIKHDGMIISIGDREKGIIIKKTWMESEQAFDELYEILRSKFAKIESQFMIHWKMETPYKFKKTIHLDKTTIQYKNVVPMLIEVKEGCPLVGQVWINKIKYSQDYFSGPLLWDNKYYIYLPYFEGPCFIVARINLKTNEMNLVGDRHEVICLDRIEYNRIYFYNNAFGENTLKSYDLKDQSLYQPFEINTKGLKKQE